MKNELIHLSKKLKSMGQEKESLEALRIVKSADLQHTIKSFVNNFASLFMSDEKSRARFFELEMEKGSREQMSKKRGLSQHICREVKRYAEEEKSTVAGLEAMKALVDTLPSLLENLSIEDASPPPPPTYEDPKPPSVDLSLPKV